MNGEKSKHEVWLGKNAYHGACLGLRAKQHTVVQGTMLRRRRKDQIKMRRERETERSTTTTRAAGQRARSKLNSHRRERRIEKVMLHR
jgi:hypothetical protein